MQIALSLISGPFGNHEWLFLWTTGWEIIRRGNQHARANICHLTDTRLPLCFKPLVGFSVLGFGKWELEERTKIVNRPNSWVAKTSNRVKRKIRAKRVKRRRVVERSVSLVFVVALGSSYFHLSFSSHLLLVLCGSYCFQVC